MNIPHNHARAEPAPAPDALVSNTPQPGIFGTVFHPVRRASDTCPLSRVPAESECPPTSPKIHELRERNLARLATESRKGSAHLKQG